MYHITRDIALDQGQQAKVNVELGVVMSGTNPQHQCNCHIYIEGLCHIRGIVVYKKMKDGNEEILLKQPGYKTPGKKYDTAYILLEKAVANVVFEAVRTIPKEQYSRFYTGPENWSIWISSIPRGEAI